MKLLILVIFITIFPTSSYSDTFEKYIEEGDLLREQFENLKALEKYQQAYSLNQDSFEIIKKLTLTYNDCGEDFRDTDMEKAKEYFRKSSYYAELASKKFSEKHFNYFLLAISYGNLARYTSGKEKVSLARNVENNLKAMINYKPDFAPSYIALGIYYREVSKLNWFLKVFAKTLMGGLPDGTLDDSKKMLLKSIELDKSIITAHYELAKTYMELNSFEKAIIHYNKVVQLPISDHQDKTKKKKSSKELKKLLKKR